MTELDFMLTRQCNAHCPICFTDSDLADSSAISSEEIVSFLSRISQFDEIEVHFTGGEPYCFLEFFDLLVQVDKLNINYQFVTNGTMLDWDKLRRLRYLKKVVFSLYGREPFHDTFVGIKGAFSKIMNAIDEISGSDADIQLNITCFDQNIDEIIPLLKNPTVQKADSVKLYPVLHKGRAEKNRISLKEEVYLELVNSLRKQELSGKIYYSETTKDVFGDCRNSSSIFINEKGDIFPCLPHSLREYRIGNIKEDSLDFFKLLSLAKRYRCAEKRDCTKSLKLI